MAPQTWALPLGCAAYVLPRPIPFQRVLLAQCCPQIWVKRIPASHPTLLYPILGLKGGEMGLSSTPVNSLQEIFSLASQPLPV